MKKILEPSGQKDRIAPAGKMTRREFLERMGLLGGGLIVYAAIGDANVLARAARRGYAGSRIPVDFNAFLRVSADNRITCFVGKIEMGQGPITSFAQMVAEELDVLYESVDMVMGDTDRCPWDAGTWGSLSTRYYGVFVKEAAAEAKGVLNYGSLTRGRVIERHLKEVPALKPVSQYSISGKPYLRRDSRDKVTGEAKFTGDMRLPGMLYAKILRPPAHGARRVSLDTSDAERLEGVKVIRTDDVVAVLHRYPDVAQQALARIKTRYLLPQTGINHENIFDHLLKHAPSPQESGRAGDVEVGRKQSAALSEETYLNSYVAHAPMETHTALAHF
ncbi:MAG: molybdopterin-dependent oxidoreductase, partial [Deltaproteobacteria bacterium]